MALCHLPDGKTRIDHQLQDGGHSEIYHSTGNGDINKIADLCYLSLVVRKPVFGVFDQFPHKLDCTATQDS